MQEYFLWPGKVFQFCIRCVALLYCNTFGSKANLSRILNLPKILSDFYSLWNAKPYFLKYFLPAACY